MILYHISTDIYHNGVFKPRVPETRADGENEEIKRICASNTIGGCFTSIPNGGSRLDMLNETQAGCYKLFRIDTEKLCIPDSDILTPSMIYDSGFVDDAELSEEHWILSGFYVPPEDAQIIYLYDWEEEVEDVIPKHIYDLSESEYGGDYEYAYHNYYGKPVPNIILITSCSFFSEHLPKGKCVRITAPDLFGADFTAEKAQANPDLDVWVENDDDAGINTLVIKAKAKANIREILKYHHRLMTI